MLYFFANLRYRYLNNAFPPVLGGETFDEFPLYTFNALKKKEFDALKYLYSQILVVDALNSSRVSPEQKLELYETSATFSSSGRKDNDIFLKK